MEISGVISAIVIGLIIGVLGRLVVPGRQHISILLTLLIGIGAALLGAVIAHAAGVGNDGGLIDWVEVLIQVVLAALGVALVAGFTGRRRIT